MSTTTRPVYRRGKTNHVPRDHYQEVTDRIIAALETGTPPWRRPWNPDKAGGPAMPRNATTGQRYRGINVLMLGMSALSGASNRLNRDLRNSFGSHDYAREELRAEIATVMICAETGIADCDFSNNAAYIASWLEKLRSDRKEIFRAAADAQRIADYLLAFHPDYAANSREAPETVPAADDGDAAAAPEPMPVAA